MSSSDQLQTFHMKSEDITVKVTEAEPTEFLDVPNSILPLSVDEQKLASSNLQSS